MNLTSQEIYYGSIVIAAIVGFVAFYFALPILDKKFNLASKLKTAEDAVNSVNQVVEPLVKILPYGSFIENVIHLAQLAVDEANQVYNGYQKAQKRQSAMDFVETTFNLARPKQPLTDKEKRIINGIIEAQVLAAKRFSGTIANAVPQNIKPEIQDQLDQLKTVETPEINGLIQDVEMAISQSKSVVQAIGTPNEVNSISEQIQPSTKQSNGSVVSSIHVTQPIDPKLTDTVDELPQPAAILRAEPLVEDPQHPGVWIPVSQLN